MNQVNIKQKIQYIWKKICVFFVWFGKKVWKYLKQAKVELLVLAAVLALDLITKAIIGATMKEGQSITLIPNFLNFHYVFNDQAAFGGSFGLDNFLSIEAIRILFLVVTSIAVVAFCIAMYVFRGKHILSRICFALIIGGALGNFCDRAALGYVRDFIEFVYFGLTIFGSKSFAIFNIADAALTIGVVIFAIYFIGFYKPAEKEFVGAFQQFMGEDGKYHLPEPTVKDSKNDKKTTTTLIENLQSTENENKAKDEIPMQDQIDTDNKS